MSKEGKRKGEAKRAQVLRSTVCVVAEYHGRAPGFGRFCADILSYEIADIHRISIEMAADVAAAAIGDRPARSDPRALCCSLSDNGPPRIGPLDPAILYQFSSFAAITLL